MKKIKNVYININQNNDKNQKNYSKKILFKKKEKNVHQK